MTSSQSSFYEVYQFLFFLILGYLLCNNRFLFEIIIICYSVSFVGCVLYYVMSALFSFSGVWRLSSLTKSFLSMKLGPTGIANSVDISMCQCSCACQYSIRAHMLKILVCYHQCHVLKAFWVFTSYSWCCETLNPMLSVIVTLLHIFSLLSLRLQDSFDISVCQGSCACQYSIPTHMLKILLCYHKCHVLKASWVFTC